MYDFFASPVRQRALLAFVMSILIQTVGVFVLMAADETTIEKGGMARPTLRQVPKQTALVMRTMVPIPERTLKKVYSLAKGMRNQSSNSYNLVLLVDVTRATNESEVTRTVETYLRGLDPNLPIPHIFPVSESILLKECPKLTNYIYNGPDEANTNDETGLCCRNKIMWQMLFPSWPPLCRRMPIVTNMPGLLGTI